MLKVSRGTVSVDGQKACSCGCGRPRDRAGQRYRKDCHAAYMAARRRGMVNVLLTPAEWAQIKAQRREAAGQLGAAAAGDTGERVNQS